MVKIGIEVWILFVLESPEISIFGSNLEYEISLFLVKIGIEVCLFCNIFEIFFVKIGVVSIFCVNGGTEE